MTVQEINEAVARKLVIQCAWTDPLTGEPEHQHKIPNYCNSISAAWEILDKYGFVLSRHSGGFTCELLISGDLASSIRAFDASANTAPLAICQAFLKLP